jgi:hypothetical protein
MAAFAKGDIPQDPGVLSAMDDRTQLHLSDDARTACRSVDTRK